jgi:hypothetical protein
MDIPAVGGEEAGSGYMDVTPEDGADDVDFDEDLDGF